MGTAKPKSTKKPVSLLRRLGRTFMATLTVLCALLSLAAVWGTLVHPGSGWPLYLLNYALLPLAFLNALFFLYWLFRLHWWALLPALVLLASWPAVRQWCPIRFGQDEYLLGKEYKILTYNTCQFAKGKGHTERHPNPVLAYLKESGADVILLQETDYPIPGKGLSQQQVSEAMASYRYQAHSPDRNHTGLWVFSKYPILASGDIAYESRYNDTFYCDIDLDGHRIRFVNNHLESNKLTDHDKDLYKDIIDKPDKENVSRVARQLGGKLHSASALRSAQARTVAEFIRKSPYPVVCCGDFNDIPHSYTYRMLSKGLTDAWVNSGRGFGVTFHEKFYRFRIDFILHSPSIVSHGTKVDHVYFSDHYPLYTYIQIP